MTKHLLTTLLIAGSASGIFAATHTQKTDFTDLKCERIAVRNSVTRLPGERVLPNTFKAPEKPEKDERDFFPVKFNAPLKNEGRNIQKMDSVVGTTLTGEPISLQTFTYTSDGQYLRADNYILDNGVPTLYSFYNYEYDDLGRLTMRERISFGNPYENARFEYFYTNNSDLFSTLVTYSVDYGTAELVPYQKVDYAYDEAGNPIEETFFYWNNSDSSWLLAGRETASFDELDRQTSYFKYVPNETGTELIGEKGETYIYVGDTLTDAEVDFYIWENSDWLKYQRHVYTYEDGLLMHNDFLYWNRAKEDWSGNDEYNGDMEANLKNDYTYDAERRLISLLGYDNSSGEYEQNYEETYAYSPLDNGDTEVIRIQSFMWQGPYLSPYTKEIQHFNAFGEETYYKQFTYYTGAERAKREDIIERDANNIYHGLTIYNFTSNEANTRYGVAKEELGYPEDWDGVSNTPSYVIVFYGGGMDTDTTWIESDKDEYEWYDEVMISNISSSYANGEFRVDFQWFIQFDFNCPASDVLKWPTNIRGEDEYKVLNVTRYYDRDHDGDWDAALSGSSIFYYSDVTTTGITDTEVLGKVVEVERYDLSGRRLEAPAKGINIVKYSDGSVRKIMVR